MKFSRFAPFIAVLLAISVAACANTIRGVGRDIKASAEAVEDSVD